MKRVLVALSGGVDSAVALYLLKKQGYDCVAATIRTWPKTDCESSAAKACCNSDAVLSARDAANKMGVPHYVFDLSAQFQNKVKDYCMLEYSKGRTPNPCVYCNSEIKFGSLLNKAAQLGCEFIATGHYARLGYDSTAKAHYLRKALDKTKDQSYFLFSLDQERLGKTLFPLGNYTKERVTAIARRLHLMASVRPSSQDICFEMERSAGPAGDIYLFDGRLLGKHKGISNYTVGQRKGLGIAYKEPLFVTRIDAENNAIHLGPKKSAFKKTILASAVKWYKPLKFPLIAQAKIRYGSKSSKCTVQENEDGRYILLFDRPVFAPTPGQAVVIYRRNDVLGGGWIESA